MKFEKEISCGNCSVTRTYRFERGTDLRGKRIECAYCGVLILAAKPDLREQVTRRAVKEPWAFMRDFLGIGSSK